MDNTILIAQTLFRAAEIREKSFTDADYGTPDQYHISMQEAVDQAISELGLDADLNLLLVMLLNSHWNESIDWAQAYLMKNRQDEAIE